MRYAELIFLLLLVAYHAVLLVPRKRRPFSANYLVFLAGMALAWNLGLEGLRWQTLPPAALLLMDLAVLFPTFSTLRQGVDLPVRFLTFLWAGLRTILAALGLVAAVASTALAVAFPLPSVELTGGLTPSYREIRFPAQGSEPSLELQVWYPASGDSRPRSRPGADADSWQRVQSAGGLPVFWQSYQQYLPSSLIRGGKTASPGTKYAVILAAVPVGQNARDFGYVFEDLASRGFIVVAGGPLPPPVEGPAEFRWETALADLVRPLRSPDLWFEPELKQHRDQGAADYRWLAPAETALRQLDSEPGDVFYESVDWKRIALWAWGTGEAPSAGDQAALGLRGAILAGGQGQAASAATSPELRLVSGQAPSAEKNRWYLSTPQFFRSDLADSAYLKPYLVFEYLKSQPEAGIHGALRQYQAAFYQSLLWEKAGMKGFAASVPEVRGILLIGR